MNTKPKIRFASRKAILDAIDDENHNHEMALKLAGQYEAEIKDLHNWFAINSPHLPVKPDPVKWHQKHDRLNLCKTELDIRIKSLPRHAAKLQLLKEALAEFDTQPMPFLTDDSVQLA